MTHPDHPVPAVPSKLRSETLDDGRLVLWDGGLDTQEWIHGYPVANHR